MISVHFQGQPFIITVIQAYAPTSNAEEAEVEQFYDAAALLGSPNAQGKPAQHIHLPLGGRTAPGKARAGRYHRTGFKSSA